MELHQLEYFVAVTEEGSFTRAAARVHVAQPGVSAQVRRLERELGQDLLDRSGRSVRLTEVGAALLPHARAALEAVAAVRLTVDELVGLVRGRVTFGMVVSAAFGEIDLPGLLASFHREHPDVEIQLWEASSAELLDALGTGQVDLAIVGLAGRPPAGIASRDLRNEHLVAAVSHDHPLAGRSSITVRALADRPLISLPTGTGLRSALDLACGVARVQPQIAFEASDPRVLAQLAAEGLGVAILPASVAEARSAELHALTITRPRIRARLALAWRAAGPTSPAAQALLGHARAVFPP